jgi:hypothetical protein
MKAANSCATKSGHLHVLMTGIVIAEKYRAGSLSHILLRNFTRLNERQEWNDVCSGLGRDYRTAQPCSFLEGLTVNEAVWIHPVFPGQSIY